MSRFSAAVLLLGLTAATGCESNPPFASSTPSTKSAAPSAGAGSWRFPAARRVIAMGDVHGDLQATLGALRIAKLIDADEHWTGGDTVLVQTGDMLDRGDGERRIVDLLSNLKDEAKKAGGAVHLLNGNHELMNAAGDFRYVTAGGFADFANVPGLSLQSPQLERLPEARRARAAAWLPGGPYAVKVAANPVVVVVGDAVFTHGGVLPNYAADVDRINREVSAWLLGPTASGPRFEAGMRYLTSPDSPVWSRHYSDDPDAADCKLLAEALAILGVKRMVVGHTVQPRIRPACDQRVWRVDVGMAAYYKGKPEVLEIQDGSIQPLAAAAP